jgi:hypothetical protein
LRIFTKVTMNTALFWDVMPRDSCKSRRLEEMYRLESSR